MEPPPKSLRACANFLILVKEGNLFLLWIMSKRQTLHKAVGISFTEFSILSSPHNILILPSVSDELSMPRNLIQWAWYHAFFGTNTTSNISWPSWLQNTTFICYSSKRNPLPRQRRLSASWLTINWRFSPQDDDNKLDRWKSWLNEFEHWFDLQIQRLMSDAELTA